LYYFNARWYDPTLGRFITEDPVKDGINWHVYVANNPLRYTDPTGLRLTDEDQEEQNKSDEKEREKEDRKDNLEKIAEDNDISTKWIRYDLQITIYRDINSYKSAWDDSYAGLDSAKVENLETGTSTMMYGGQTVSNSDKVELSPNGVFDTLVEDNLMLGRYERTDSKKFDPGQRLAVIGGKTYAGGVTNISGKVVPGGGDEGVFMHVLRLAGEFGEPSFNVKPDSAGCPGFPEADYNRGAQYLQNNNLERGQYVPIIIRLIGELHGGL
jgi:hypothetical protein